MAPRKAAAHEVEEEDEEEEVEEDETPCDSDEARKLDATPRPRHAPPQPLPPPAPLEVFELEQDEKDLAYQDPRRIGRGKRQMGSAAHGDGGDRRFYQYAKKGALRGSAKRRLQLACPLALPPQLALRPVTASSSPRHHDGGAVRRR